MRQYIFLTTTCTFHIAWILKPYQRLYIKLRDTSGLATQNYNRNLHWDCLGNSTGTPVGTIKLTRTRTCLGIYPQSHGLTMAGYNRSARVSGAYHPNDKTMAQAIKTMCIAPHTFMKSISYRSQALL